MCVKIEFLSSAYVVSPGPTSRNSFYHSFRIQFSRLYSVQSVVRALTTRELYSLRSTHVHTLNTNSAHNTLRNKIGMSVSIAVVGIQQSGKVQDYWHKYRLCELEVNHELARASTSNEIFQTKILA